MNHNIKLSTALGVTTAVILAAIGIIGIAGGIIHAQSPAVVSQSAVAVTGMPMISSSIASTSVSAMATSSAITWVTPKVATSQVMYGTTTPYSDTQTGNLALDHTVVLGGLSPNTTYHFDISSDDGSGVTTSPDQTFTTLPLPNFSMPIISGVLAVPTYSIATIIWTTDQPTNSEVLYGEGGLGYTASTTGDASFAPVPMTQHMVSISGLSPNTTYHFAVVSTNPAGVTATSTDRTFTTTSAPTE